MSEFNGTPLPVDGGTGPTMEETLERLRQVYSAAFSDIMDRVLEELLLPDDKVTVCLDAMQFATFILCLKAVEARGQKPTRENLMAVYWPMQKALKDDVPGMLRQFADAVAEGARG